MTPEQAISAIDAILLPHGWVRVTGEEMNKAFSNEYNHDCLFWLTDKSTLYPYVFFTSNCSGVRLLNNTGTGDLRVKDALPKIEALVQLT